MYREQIDVVRPVSILAPPGGRPWLSGADVVDSWISEGGRWWTEAPAVQRGGWSTGMIGAEPEGLVDVVAVDGIALAQVISAALLGPGTFFVDDSAGRLWLGDDPTDHVIEVSTSDHAIVFRSVPGSRLEGIGVRHYATAPVIGQRWRSAAGA